MSLTAISEQPILSSRRTLQDEIARGLAVFMLVTGYIWTWLNIYPVTGRSASAASWIGGGFLLGAALWSFGGRRMYPTLNIYILIMALVTGAVAATLLLPFPSAAYLFVVPIIFASTLFSRSLYFLFATLTISLLIFHPFYTTALTGIHSLLLVGIIVTITVASWLSARTLQMTLHWFSDAYERSYQNEQLVREHVAELRRVLWALDETTYRLERANERLQYERNQAESARRLKQQLAQTISHELRTPLNLIISFVDMMAQSPEYYGSSLPTPYMRDLSIVHKNAMHLLKLVNDVLDLARVEAAQMSLITEPVAPAQLVSDVVQTARSLVESRGLALKVELADDLPEIEVDPTRIRQVLLNLLNNAARFTDSFAAPEGYQGSVTVRAEANEKEVSFAVIDTGVGITEEYLDHIFEEFSQVDGGTRRRHGGVGLGLAICQRFVKLHGGRIWVESTPGVGSTFTFTLPIVRRVQTGWTSAPPVEVRAQLLIVTSASRASLFDRLSLTHSIVIVPDMDQARRAADQLRPGWVLLDTAHLLTSAESLKTLVREWQYAETNWIFCALPATAVPRPDEPDASVSKPVTREGVMKALATTSATVESALMVSADADLSRLMRRILENAPYQYRIVTALDSDEALALLQHHDPDLIWVDAAMGEGAVSEFIRSVRSRNTHRPLPILLIGEGAASNAQMIMPMFQIARSSPMAAVDFVGWIQAMLKTGR